MPPSRREAEDRLDEHAQHPARAARVPGPAAAPDVGRRAVDVGGHDVGLHLVARDGPGVARVPDRASARSSSGAARSRRPSSAIARTSHRARVGVLAAVLADARHVALDVAGVVGRVVEGRRQQPDQPALE